MWADSSNAGWMLLLALCLAGCGGKAVIDDATGSGGGTGEGDGNGADDNGVGNGGVDNGGMGSGGAVCPRLIGPAATSTEWSQVLDMLTDPEAGACSLNACHGEEASAADGIFLPVVDPGSTANLALYRGLTGVTNGTGRRYVDPMSPADSWMQCHIETHGNLDIYERGWIKDWIILGAKHPEGP